MNSTADAKMKLRATLLFCFWVLCHSSSISALNQDFLLSSVLLLLNHLPGQRDGV